jgi:hypothetical protein
MIEKAAPIFTWVISAWRNLPVILVYDFLHLIEDRLRHVVHVDRWLVPGKEVDDDCLEFSQKERLAAPQGIDSPGDHALPRSKVRLAYDCTLLVRDRRTEKHEL